MDEAVIKKTLIELNQAITAAPSRSTRVQNGVYVSDAEPVQSIEDTVDHLRLQIKYLVFDLEATRRENRYLRQLIENRPQPPKDEGI